MKVLVAIDFRFVFSALRAVFDVAARDGRETVVVAARVLLLLRKSKARDDADVTVGRVVARARTESVRVVAFERFMTFVVARDTTDESRGMVVNAAEFVRDKESVPRTAADDAPKESATITIEIISFFISVR